MANTTMKFPDGRTESINVLTHFEKNGVNVIVFETDKVDNGLKVTGVSYLSDGMYQNIVDQNKWDEVKSYLVDILHDRITNEEYRLVPEEVSVTLDPYHPLSLRDANLDKVIASYENFKNSALSTNKVEENVNAEDISIIPEQNNVEEISNVEPVIETPEEISSMGDQVIENPVEIPVISDDNIAGAIPNVEPIMETPEEMPSIGDQVIENPVEIPVISEDNIVGEIPNVEPIMETPEEMPSIGNQVIENPVEIPANDGVTDIPILDNIAESTNNMVTPKANEEVNEEDNNKEESVVTNTYLTKMANIKQEMLELTNEYITKIQDLSNEYAKRMEEKEKEATEYLAEAKDLNKLSRQTFEKTQSMTPLTESLTQTKSNGIGSEMLSRVA